MILVQRNVSSAYSRRETKPSFDPSGRRQLGTRMYRQRRHATVSHSTDVLSVKWRVNVRRNGSLLLTAFNNSSSCVCCRHTSKRVELALPVLERREIRSASRPHPRSRENYRPTADRSAGRQKKDTYLHNAGAHRELTLLDPHAAALCVDCRYRQCGMGHIRTTTEAPRPALYNSAVAA